jgi:hypothetical protein
MKKELAQLGDLVEDKVTGFTGIVVAETKWLNGCFRLTVQPRGLDKDGKVFQTEGFDIEQLIVREVGALDPKPKERKTNGPMPSVSRGY